MKHHHIIFAMEVLPSRTKDLPPASWFLVFVAGSVFFKKAHLISQSIFLLFTFRRGLFLYDKLFWEYMLSKVNESST